MSRKTRKLIWSAPLVAVLAVAGALAIFAALAPNAALATHEMLPGAPTDLLVKPASGNDARTSLVLTWTAPENSSVTGYRIDYSMDNVVYKELVPDSASTATTYTHSGLDSGKMYIYRVFAINSAGTGPVSETYSNTTMGTAGTPDDVTGLTAARAATTPAKWSQIDLSWTEPYGGGKKITGYCIEFVDNAATTSWPDDDAGCRATSPVAVDFATGSTAGVILTDNAMTKYEHEMQPAGTRRYYRVFAMTSATAVSEMPSNEASAITAAREVPMPPGTLRAAKNAAGTAVNLYWYWPNSNGGMAITNFRVEVTTNERNWPEPSETDSDNGFDGATVTNVVGTTAAVHDDGVLPPVTAASAQSLTAMEQATHTHAVPVGVTDKRLYYRVFTETGTVADNDVLRSGYSNTASVVVNGGSNPTMPIFDSANDDDTGATGGDGEIDLMWKAGTYDHDGDGATADDPNADPPETAPIDFPASGYRIDYAEGMAAAAADDTLMWKPLWGNTGFSDTRFTHQSLKPETRVYYRVFAIGSAQTISAAAGPEDATTDEAGALGKVQNVRAVADSSTQITVTWDRPMDTSASDIKQYNVQMRMLGTDIPADTAFMMTESGSVTTYPHKGLSESQTWLYRVAAVKVGRTDNPMASEYTAWVTATTPEAGKPDMPIGLVAENARDSNLTAVGARGVLLIWNMPEGPAGSMVGMYKIERKVMGKDSDYIALGMSTGTRTTYTDSDEPDDGEMRYYRVAAVSKTSVVGEWAEVRFPAADLMHNNAPMAKGTIANLTVMAGQMSEAMDVSMYFSDADTDDTLIYTAMSNMEMYATAAVSGSMLTITGVAEGEATITVTATDAAGAKATQTFRVTVTSAMLTAPTAVMASDTTESPGNLTIEVNWTNGANALSHLVLLLDTSDYSVAKPAATQQDDGMTSFSNLDRGTYIAVVVAYDADTNIQLAISNTISVGGG